MALYPLALPLSTARTNVQVQGRAAWLAAYVVNATVTPTVHVQSPAGNTRDLLVTLPVTVQTPMERVLVSNAIGSGTLYLLMSDDPCDSIAVGSSGAGAASYGGDNFDTDLLWPPIRRTITVGGAYEVNASPRQGTPNDYGALWGSFFGAGASTMDVMLANTGWMAGRFVAARLGWLEGWPMYLNPLIPAGVPASWSRPAQSRVWWLSYVWRSVAGVPGTTTGMAFAWCAGVTGSPVTASLTLCGTGGGAMQIAAYQLGPGMSFNTPIAWPLALTVPVTHDWLFWDANGVRPARVQLFLNGSLAWSGEWAAATWPMPAHQPGANKLIPCLMALDAGNEVRVTDVRCRTGRFDLYGAEVG